MTPLRLTSSFRRRMLPLVALSSLTVAAAAPTAFHVVKRRELVGQARADAERVAGVLRAEAERRPTLWRYASTKLTERLITEGLHPERVAAMVVHDADGVPVPIGGVAKQNRARSLWGRWEVVAAGERVATVWVATDAAPVTDGTLRLAAIFVLLGLLLGIVLYLVPMRAIAVAEKRVVALMDRLALTLQEEERRRIARDLHDGAGQAMTAARLGLLALRRQLEAADVASLDRIAALLDEALDEVRRSTAALGPPALAELGLCGALERHCVSFADATHLPVELRVGSDVATAALSPQIETACYRIVQEALTNVARHAGATRAWVHLDADAAALRIEVGDDGSGFGAHAAAPETIRERVRLVGGSVRVGDGGGENGGARIHVTVPLGGAPA